MGIQVTTKIKGMQALTTDIGQGIKRVKDARPAFHKMAANLRQAIGTEQFRSEGRARGTPWAPLAPSTLSKRRNRKGYYGRFSPRGRPGILHWTGGLRRSFEVRTSGQHLERIDRQSMEWGSRLPPRPRREPERPIVAFKPGEEDEFLSRPLLEHVMKPLR